MSGWWTPPGEPGAERIHRNTGARNMREHREAKRVQADTRNATTQPENRSRKAERAASETSDRPGTVAPAGRAGKRSRQRSRKSSADRLAAHERATREWLDRHGPGVDF